MKPTKRGERRSKTKNVSCKRAYLWERSVARATQLGVVVAQTELGRWKKQTLACGCSMCKPEKHGIGPRDKHSIRKRLIEDKE